MRVCVCVCVCVCACVCVRVLCVCVPEVVLPLLDERGRPTFVQVVPARSPCAGKPHIVLADDPRGAILVARSGLGRSLKKSLSAAGGSAYVGDLPTSLKLVADESTNDIKNPDFVWHVLGIRVSDAELLDGLTANPHKWVWSDRDVFLPFFQWGRDLPLKGREPVIRQAALPPIFGLDVTASVVARELAIYVETITNKLANLDKEIDADKDHESMTRNRALAVKRQLEEDLAQAKRRRSASGQSDAC